MKTLKYSMMVLVGMLIIVGNASAQDLTVTSPNGGETWVIGYTKPITWTYSGPICRLKILLELGMQRWKIADNIPADQRSYLWRVGDYKEVITGPQVRPPAATSYKIRLTIEPRGHTSCKEKTSSSNDLFTLTDKEMKKVSPVKPVGPSFKCTFKSWSGGLPAGGPAGGAGQFDYGMTINVTNVGSTKSYWVYGSLQLNVNGANKSKTCSLPPGQFTRHELDWGKSASHSLNCGSESNVHSSEVISGQAYVESDDGKKFYCTPDTSVPKVY